MQYGIIKPRTVKIFKPRFCYRRWGLPLMKPLLVVGCDMDAVLVEWGLRVFKVFWKDVNLVTTEQVTQISAVYSDAAKTIIKERKPKRSLFDTDKNPTK